MPTLSLKVPKVLDVRLTAAAKRRGATKSAVVREALQEYLSRREAHAPLSVAELTKEFIGCVDGGPPDLSYNKKYMKGFGK